MKAIFDLDSIGFRYGKKQVLRNISFRIEPGEILGVIGPNGSGKTTLLKTLGRQLIPSEGSLLFEQGAMAGVPGKEYARRVSMVPQDHAILFPYSVYEIVLMGRYPHINGWAFESEVDHRIARSAMEEMGIDSMADRPFNELSGGERQRVIIARSLAQSADVLLLDEPATFLDLHYQIEMFSLEIILNLGL